jgi:HD-GYP domain-containing protein (c-di-GMP phosphodiesterase class II)
MPIKLEDKIEKLNRIGIALSAVHDIDELLELIVTEARHLTGADAGSLYLRDGDSLYFRVAQNDTLEKKFGDRSNFFKPFKIKISKENIAGYVALTSKPLNIADAYELSKDLDYKHSKEFDEKFGYRTKSILAVPMVDHKSDVIGIVQLINPIDKNNNVISFPKSIESLVSSLASQAAVAINNAKFIDEVKNLFKAVVQYSASAIDARSPHTAGHSERVSKLAVALAEALNNEKDGYFANIGFSEDEIEEIRYAGWLHDIGKIGVKEIVLDKQTKVSKDAITSLSYKFYTLILQKHERLLETQINALKGLIKDDIANLDDLIRKYEDERTRLSDDLTFLKRINIPTERMTDADIERLKNLKLLLFSNPITGKEETILEEEDYDNLSVLRGSLNEKERKEAQSHVVISIKILKQIPFRGYMKNIPDIVANHHEYLDGTGYPNGLKAESISLQSRILCVVDIFDALVAKDRPYKPAMPLETALNILKKDAQAGKLDKELVELFIRRKAYESIHPQG